MECGMERRFHRGFTAAEKTELWDRWKRGESLKAIGRASTRCLPTQWKGCKQKSDAPKSGGGMGRLGEVRRVIAAAPAYLSRHPVINKPADLAKHQIVSMTHFGQDSWSFPPLKNSSVPRTVQFTPRLIVNTVRAAVASAAEGNGVTRLFSYHIAEQIRDGRLKILLDKDEHSLIKPQ
jgi:DNA-binding transcriptional LysR family regulator